MDIKQLLEDIQQTNFEVTMKIEDYKETCEEEILSIIHDINVLDSKLATAQLQGDLSSYNRNLINEERFYLQKNIEEMRHAYGIFGTYLKNIILTLDYPNFQQ